MDLQFGMNITIDYILNEFEGQGHRSKVKVVRLKNVIFGILGVPRGHSPLYIMEAQIVTLSDVMGCYGVTSCRDVMTSQRTKNHSMAFVCQSLLAAAMCEMSVLEGLWGKNTDKEGVAGGRVNAQAFSFSLIIDL